MAGWACGALVDPQAASCQLKLASCLAGNLPPQPSPAASPVAGPQRLHGDGAHGTPAGHALQGMIAEQRGACGGSGSGRPTTSKPRRRRRRHRRQGSQGGRAPAAARDLDGTSPSPRARPQCGTAAGWLPALHYHCDLPMTARSAPPSSGLRRAAAEKYRGAVAEASTAAASPAPRAAARARSPARRPARRMVCSDRGMPLHATAPRLGLGVRRAAAAPNADYSIPRDSWPRPIYIDQQHRYYRMKVKVLNVMADRLACVAQPS